MTPQGPQCGQTNSVLAGRARPLAVAGDSARGWRHARRAASVARTQEVVRQRASRISAVMSHPGWEEHVAEAKRKIERVERIAMAVAKL